MTNTDVQLALATEGAEMTISQQIQDELRKEGGQLTVTELSDRIQRDKQNVYAAVSALAKKGIIKKIGLGTYTLTENPGEPVAPRQTQGNRDATRTKVLSYLRAHPNSPRQTIVEKVGVAASTLTRMARDGEITSEWTGHGKGSGKRGGYNIYRLADTRPPATEGSENGDSRKQAGRPQGAKTGTGSGRISQEVKRQLEGDARIAAAAQILFPNGQKPADWQAFLHWVDATREMMSNG